MQFHNSLFINTGPKQCTTVTFLQMTSYFTCSNRHIFPSYLFFSPFVTWSLVQYLSFLRETKWILSRMQSKTEIKPDGGEKQAANPTLTTFKVLPKTYEAHENQIARRMMETLLGIRRLED